MVRSFLTPVKSILRPSLVTFPFGLYFYHAQFVRMEATKSAIGDTTWNGRPMVEVDIPSGPLSAENRGGSAVNLFDRQYTRR
jgi:hypothetical protein